MHAFAREHREANKTKWMEAERLGGFCLLIKRQVLEKIGLPKLEKWTDLSLFDTDILSVKALGRSVTRWRAAVICSSTTLGQGRLVRGLQRVRRSRAKPGRENNDSTWKGMRE